MRNFSGRAWLYSLLEISSHLALNHWQSFRRAPCVNIDSLWRSWLLDRGSLTERLLAVTQGDFFVRVLHQRWQRPQLSEAKRLGLKPRQVALIREVQLMCHNEAWVYARSVFPLNTLSGRLGYLKKLDNRSLGSLLFKDPHLSRTWFEIASIDGSLITSLGQQAPTENLWGRRSLFYIKEKPILVAEIFLPALKAHLEKLQL
ncbi:MAG: chorismate lyase [Pseudomonadales bacterium]|nr:chorismate lyase [Pseudomonadales bacterium]